jgi:hypothetical protein
MTTPVLIDLKADARKMSFIVPNDVAAKGVPKPTDGAVTIGRMDAGRFAVLRFEGKQSAAREAGRSKTCAAGFAPKGCEITASRSSPTTIRHGRPISSGAMKWWFALKSE